MLLDCAHNVEGARALVAALSHAKSPATRPIIHLLGGLKSKKAYKLLKALANDPDPYVSADAKQALAGIQLTLIERIF